MLKSIDASVGTEANLPPGSRSSGGGAADACPACAGTEYRTLFAATDRVYVTTDKWFHVVECRQCWLIRLHPQPGPRERNGYYPAGYWTEPETTAAGRIESLYDRLVLRDPVRFVERALRDSGEPGIVLDLGRSGGAFLRTLEERGRSNVVGFNVTLDAVSTLSGASLAPGSCAAVTMFQVLEHLYEPAHYLEAARELLAPEGRLIVQVPNAACWQFLLFGERWSGLDVPRRLVHYRRKDLESLLDDCGFEILRYQHFSWRDNPRGMATSLAPLLDPAGRRLRQVKETPRGRLWKDLAFLGLVAVCVPFTLLEAACHAGSTVMIEARKKS